MATTRSTEKEAFWRMAMEEHRNSGLAIRAFCKQQGISEPSFYAWRRELRERDAQGQAPSVLVPVDLVEQQEAATDKLDPITLRIATPSGFTVDVQAESTCCAAGIAVELERHWRSTGDASC